MTLSPDAGRALADELLACPFCGEPFATVAKRIRKLRTLPGEAGREALSENEQLRNEIQAYIFDGSVRDISPYDTATSILLHIDASRAPVPGEAGREADDRNWLAIRNELDRTRAERDSWKAQFESAAAAASEYSEFWEQHNGEFDAGGNYIPHSQIDGDLRAAKAEIASLKGADAPAGALREMDELLAEAADELNVSSQSSAMDLGSKITQWRRARQNALASSDREG